MSELNAQMAALRNKVGEIAELIPRGKPVVFLDYPVYLNVGDLLIAKGTETFFRAFGYRVTTTRSAIDCDDAQIDAFPPDATIVFQGGGNFGDLYDLHQQFRERVIARCPTNRIVILPQTIHFESAARLAECAAVFARHPDLHVCVRDHTSHDLISRHFPNPAYLFPDMAHFLWDEMAPQRQRARSGSTLLFMRVDKEGSPFVHEPTAGQTPIDWRDIMSLTDRVAFALLLRLHQRHGDLLPGHEIHPFWRMFSDRMIRKAIRTVAPHSAVVTNRLHMALLGLLMGRKVEMADNSYGKLSAYYGCWLETIPTVELLSSRAPAAPLRSWATAAV